MKTKMKIAMATLAALALAFVVAGCSQPEGGAQQSAQQSSSAAAESSASTSESGSSAASDEASKPEPLDAAGKVLVAYFSASGNTERIATGIAESLDADLFPIEPAQPYTSQDLNWNDQSSRVSAEHDDESLRNVELAKVTPDDFAAYDTVFIGYPIWWGIAAWPVNGFVSGNDFAGKTVVPFCTSASSSLGESAELLEGLSGGGTWLEGHRFSSSATAANVQEWLSSLDLNK